MVSAWWWLKGAETTVSGVDHPGLSIHGKVTVRTLGRKM